MELLRDHKAFCLLFSIANQSSESGDRKEDLEAGEARINFDDLNLTRGEYRAAYKRLEALMVISARPSRRGMVHKIIMDSLFIPSSMEPIDLPEFPERPTFLTCPQIEIIALYHEHCPDLPPVLSWNRTMANHLRDRWREEPVRQSLEWWEKFLKVSVAGSDFLCGRIGTWNAALDWIVIKQNWDKIINGRYRNRKRSPEEQRHAPEIYIPPK